MGAKDQPVYGHWDRRRGFVFRDTQQTVGELQGLWMLVDIPIQRRRDFRYSLSVLQRRKVAAFFGESLVISPVPNPALDVQTR